MRILIVEDDYITSQVLEEILSAFGNSDIAENGLLGVQMFKKAHDEASQYDIIFLDIMMPELDGQGALAQIRKIEHEAGIKGLDCVKIIMTTALDDFDNIKTSFGQQCEGYLVKPIDREKITEILIKLDLVD